ncbi:MAG: IS3 family transposase [Dehalococcoidia bacterium]|nr:IS3 family transposase [Dehalococcoidia bacterium]
MRPNRRYSEEEKRILLNTVARAQEQSNQPLSWILAELGLTRSVYYDWLEKAETGSLADHVVVPRSPLAALPEEIEAVVAYAKVRPRDGYRRLTWMMVDEDVVYLAPSTVYRILDKHDLLYRWKRPEPGQGRRAPEATYPNEVWHIDLMYLWVRGRWYFLVTILDSYSRYIVHWELALSMRAEEIAEITAIALERVHGKKPRIVRDNGSQFVAKEWREVMRYFEVEEIPIRARHPESNGRIERYHRSVREEAFGDTEVEDLYRARELLAEWVRYYNEERLHSSLEYLRPVDYYLGNPQALLAERKRKLREAAAQRREVNRGKKEIRLVNGAPELGRSEGVAEAIAEART